MIKKLDWQILGAGLIISVISLFTLLSTTIDSSGNVELGGIVLKQILFIGIGLIIFYVVSRLDYTYFKHYQVSIIFYAITVLLLILTMALGQSVNGAKRWITIAGVQVQASELAKIAIVLLTASIMTHKSKLSEWKRVVISGGFMLLLMVLVYVQPHTTMSLIIAGLWAVTVFTMISNQLRVILLLLIFGLGFIGAVLLVNSINAVLGLFDGSCFNRCVCSGFFLVGRSLERHSQLL